MSAILAFSIKFKYHYLIAYIFDHVHHELIIYLLTMLVLKLCVIKYQPGA